MDVIFHYFTLSDTELLAAGRAVGRLVVAILLGAVLGFERERRGRAAGLRTHSLVALGAALFTVVPMLFGATAADLAQVVKGLAAGVGFLGAGAILKGSEQGDVQGLTTAANIWLTVAGGGGRLSLMLRSLSVTCGRLAQIRASV